MTRRTQGLLKEAELQRTALKLALLNEQDPQRVSLFPTIYRPSDALHELLVTAAVCGVQEWWLDSQKDAKASALASYEKPAWQSELSERASLCFESMYRDEIEPVRDSSHEPFVLGGE
jgi:hypothetical protein